MIPPLSSKAPLRSLLTLLQTPEDETLALRDPRCEDEPLCVFEQFRINWPKSALGIG